MRHKTSLPDRILRVRVILNDGFLNLTLLRRINLDLPVHPVILPALCGVIDTKNK